MSRTVRAALGPKVLGFGVARARSSMIPVRVPGAQCAAVARAQEQRAVAEGAPSLLLPGDFSARRGKGWVGAWR